MINGGAIYFHPWTDLEGAPSPLTAGRQATSKTPARRGPAYVTRLRESRQVLLVVIQRQPAGPPPYLPRIRPQGEGARSLHSHLQEGSITRGPRVGSPEVLQSTSSYCTKCIQRPPTSAPTSGTMPLEIHCNTPLYSGLGQILAFLPCQRTGCL